MKNLDIIEEEAKEKETFGNAIEEWHAVRKGFKQNNGRTHQVQQPVYQNIHNAFQDNTPSEDKEDEETTPIP